MPTRIGGRTASLERGHSVLDHMMGGWRGRLLVVDILVALAIFAVALPPRQAFIDSYSEPPQSEEELYNRYAVPYALGEGAEPREKAFPWHPLASFTHRPPGYTVFLGIVYRLAGIENYDAVRQVQAYMDSSSMVLIYVLGALAFGGALGRLIGASAAFATAQYDFLLMFTARLLSETLFTWLMLVGLVLAILATRRRAPLLSFGAAFFFGLANITRPFLVFLLPAYLLWLAVAPEGGRLSVAPNARSVRGWIKDRRAHLLAATLGMVLSVGAVTLRNWQFHGEFVLLSTNSGYTMWHGLTQVEGLTAPEELGTEDAVKDLELGEIGTSAEFQRIAVEYLRRHPGDIVLALERRVRILLAGKGGHKISHVLMVTPDDEWFYEWSLALAALGVVLRPRVAWHPRLLIYAAILSQLAVSLIANAEVRYRVPAVPLLAILAAWAVWGLLEIVGRGGIRRLMGERTGPAPGSTTESADHPATESADHPATESADHQATESAFHSGSGPVAERR